MTKTKITTLLEALRACQDNPEAMQLALDYAAGHKGESVEYMLNTQKLRVVWNRLRAVDHGEVIPVVTDDVTPNATVVWFDLGEDIQVALMMTDPARTARLLVAGFAYGELNAYTESRAECPIMAAIVGWTPSFPHVWMRAWRDACRADRDTIGASLDTSPR